MHLDHRAPRLDSPEPPLAIAIGDVAIRFADGRLDDELEVDGAPLAAGCFGVDGVFRREAFSSSFGPEVSAAGAVGIGIGRRALGALRHAAFDALERALFASLWYEEERLWLAPLAGPTSSIRSCVLMHRGQWLPMVISVAAPEGEARLCTGIALKPRLEQAIAASRREALARLAEARAARREERSSDASREAAENARACFEHLEARTGEVVIEPAAPPMTTCVAIQRSLSALRDADAEEPSLALAPVATTPWLHVWRAVLGGAKASADRRATPRAIPRDPFVGGRRRRVSTELRARLKPDVGPSTL